MSAFVRDLEERYELLLRYGAQEAAAALKATREDFEDVLGSWLDETLSVRDVATILSCSPETVRRQIRAGKLVDRRPTGSGHHRIRRGDVFAFDGRSGAAYDADADAQDIATRRRLE